MCDRTFSTCGASGIPQYFQSKQMKGRMPTQVSNKFIKRRICPSNSREMTRRPLKCTTDTIRREQFRQGAVLLSFSASGRSTENGQCPPGSQGRRTTRRCDNRSVFNKGQSAWAERSGSFQEPSSNQPTTDRRPAEPRGGRTGQEGVSTQMVPTGNSSSHQIEETSPSDRTGWFRSLTALRVLVTALALVRG
jgi:hypothetical protein